MSKILAVFGATGNQGGSVIEYVLNDSKLSKEFKIRAITRDLKSETAKRLAEKVEVVHGDFDNRASLVTALKGVHTVFAMTNPAMGQDALEVEYKTGKDTADIALEQGAQYIIFSTLPNVSELSGGKYTKVTNFDSKAKIEAYIRTLPIKSAFYCPGFFMSNMDTQPFSAPQPAGDGTWNLIRLNSIQTQLPLIDIGETGKFVTTILRNPDMYEGKTFFAAEKMYSYEEQCAILSKATGKKVVYKQLSTEEYRESLVPILGEGFADLLVDAFGFCEDYGFFGPKGKELAEWAQEQTGKLSTFEEYLKINPLNLK